MSIEIKSNVKNSNISKRPVFHVDNKICNVFFFFLFLAVTEVSNGNIFIGKILVFRLLIKKKYIYILNYSILKFTK